MSENIIVYQLIKYCTNYNNEKIHIVFYTI
jgi:hypothetical protein